MWPLAWWKDHTFWRDVAARTASGLLVVILGYVGAIGLGYIGTPDGRRVAFTVAMFIVWVLTILGWIVIFPSRQVVAKLPERLSTKVRQGISGTAEFSSLIVVLVIEYLLLVWAYSLLT